jgi:hypothetical protein
MKRQFRTLSIILLISILITACNIPGSTASTATQIPVLTQAEATKQETTTSSQPTTQPMVTVTQALTTPTATTVPTATSTPVPTATSTVVGTPVSCTDQAKFVEDVTIPDNSEMLPAQDFIKTWRLENTGTCTWTNAYALIFISGDQMSGSSPLPLTGTTAPGNSVDVSVSLKAPGSVGTYQGNWELRNPNGVNFGTGTNASQAFYVLINVVEGVSQLNLGPATWTDNMDTADNWYLLDTANTKFAGGDGKLVMTAKSPSGADEWGLSNKPALKDYYLQATFITGGACSGLDHYGLLARAPDPNKGYVLEFSCDGHYRLYKWDGKNYTALQEWHTTSTIHTGANQTNIMGIWMKGTTLRVYANGFKLAEFTDSTYNQGQFGLVIGSVNTNNLTVNVDQVAYWDFSGS